MTDREKESALQGLRDTTDRMPCVLRTVQGMEDGTGRAEQGEGRAAAGDTGLAAGSCEMDMEGNEMEQAMMMQEPTRKGILKEFLEIEEGQLRALSKNPSKLEPKPGREARWEMQRKRCELLRDMIQALGSEPVQRAMSDWQRLVMEEDKLGRNHQLTL